MEEGIREEEFEEMEIKGLLRRLKEKKRELMKMVESKVVWKDL